MGRTKAIKLISPDLGTGNSEASYVSQAIVAFTEDEAPEGFALAKLQEDVLEKSEKVKVSFLQEGRVDGENVVYKIEVEGEIEVSKIMREIQYKILQQKGKKQSQEFYIERNLIDDVKKTLKEKQDALKNEEKLNQLSSPESSDQEEPGSESSDDEEEEEEEEEVKQVEQETSKRPLKKAVGRKAANASETDKIETEEKPAITTRRSTRNTPAKKDDEEETSKKVTRATKKKVGEEKIVETKKDDIDDGEEEPTTTGKKAKKKEKTDKPEKAKKPPKAKKMPDVYKKGKWNPSVEVIKHHRLLMDPSDDLIDYDSVKTTNKNLIRAVYTKNYTLLEKILNTDYALSKLHQEWAPENNVTALELAIRQKDVKAAELLLTAETQRDIGFRTEPAVGLKEVDTGNVSKAAFGVEIRKVNLTRGGKEGNNAFTHDLKNRQFDLKSLFGFPLEKEILDSILSKQSHPEVIACIDKLVLCGDRHNAAYLVGLANEAGGFGFNNVHQEALTKEKASELTQGLKKVAVTKKALGNSGITPLHCAAINPNQEILEALLEVSRDISLPDEKMRRLIHYAACCEGLGPLKVLLPEGADATEKDATGLTPLMYAAYYGRAENARILIEDGKVDPLDKTKDGMMAIHWAAQRGHLDVLKVLVEKGVKLAVKGGKAKMAPLHFAAAYNHWECVEFLIEKRASVLAKDSLKRTPLCMAVRNGNLEIASYLLQRGSDYAQADSSNNYPLHYAAAYGFSECLDVLIKAGADFNVQNAWKLTPLAVAMLKNNYHCVRALLAYPTIDVEAKDDFGRTLVSILVEFLSEENFERICYLIKERNCDVNVADIEGFTPLHFACQLTASSLVPPKDSNNSDALKKAQNLKIALIKLLLEYKADVNAKTKNEKKRPLQFAIDAFDPELIELLINHENIDLTFEDAKQNNVYRLLFKHTIKTEHQELLEKVLKRAGDAAKVLNKEKAQSNDYYRSSYGYYNNYYRNRYNPETNDPTVSDESVFTCIKRELMKEGLQSYLDEEKSAAQSKKREILVQEENKRVEELVLERERKRKEEEEKAKSQENGGGLFNNFSYNRIDRKYIPEYNKIELNEEETQSYKEEAYKRFNQLVVENLDLLTELAKAGGELAFKEILEARDDLYNDPRYMIWALDTFKPNLSLPQEEKNPIVFTLISKRTKLVYTPEALRTLVDYIAKLGGKDQETLEKYSQFKLMLELFSRFGADFNMKNPKGVTPVLHLLRDKNPANADFLDDIMDYGVDVKNTSDNDGTTPFFEAIKSLDKIIVQKLIGYGIDINQKDKKGKAAIHYIAEGGIVTVENKTQRGKATTHQIVDKIKADAALEIANILLKLPDIDIEIRDTLNSRTPLHFALLNWDNLAMVETLLKAGADGNAQDKHGSNALFFATKVGSLPMMQALAEKVKDPNVPGELGYTPLHHAIEKGAMDLVDYLLKIGADPNLKDQKGRTGLMAAVMFKNIDVVKVLLKRGANPNEKDEKERTPLHYAVNNSTPEQMFEMEDVLLRSGAQVNALDMYERSPLHYAFIPIEGNGNFHNQNDPVETVTGLCAAEGVDLDIKDRRGRRPIHYAATYGAYISILLIIKEKITFDEADADGNTPLALALQFEHKDTAAIFIQNEANVKNQIFRLNEKNFLWAHPKDENWDELKKEHDQKKEMQIEEVNGDGGVKEITAIEEETPAEVTKMVVEDPEPSSENTAGKAQKDTMEEEDDDGEDDEGSQDSDDKSDKGVWENVEPNEAKDNTEEQAAAAAAKQQEEEKIPLILTGVQQQAIDSFFAKSIRRGWQGVAYLLLKNGFDTMQAIQDALNERQFRYVMALMTKTPNSNLKNTDSNGQNLFHIFATKGRDAPSDFTEKIFEGLLMKGVDFNLKDSKGRTPLHYAAELRFSFLEAKLLENGCNPNIEDQRGYTAFTLSLMNYPFTMDRLEKYASHNADLNMKFKEYDQETTPLHYAAKHGFRDIERKMLSMGADPNIEDSQGLTPLQKAFIRGSCDVDSLAAYYEAKADLNKLFTLTYTHENKEMQKTYTLLIYAVEKNWAWLEEKLLTYGVDSSIENSENKTAFEIALTQATGSLTGNKLELYARCKAPVSKPIRCRIRGKKTKVTPVLYVLNLKDKTVDPQFIKGLLDSGVSVNDADRDGWTAVTYAIRRNWTALLQILLSYQSLDSKMSDKNGKTPIHHVVNPMDYASYENVEMLELLATRFDINQVDKRGKAPIYYAYFQDSGTMKEALLRLGATDQKPSGGIQRQATSIIAGVDWMEEVDYEDDADKYIDALENNQINIEDAYKTPVDQDAHNNHYLEVVSDDVLGPYSLYMTKVDIGKGGYGEYLFYRMQVLHDKNRDNYILFTKWGRIGDRGMHQETPHPTKEDCIKDFCKIFKDKSGNEWSNKANFQKVEKKYRLLNISTRKNQKEYLKPFNWADETLPASTLSKPIQDLVKSMSDVKSYQQWFGRCNIDERVLPFGKLSKDLIFEAKKILLGLREVIEEMEELNEKERQENMKKLNAAADGEVKDEKNQEILIQRLKLKEKILEGSSRFYELIPDTRFQLKPVEPIETSKALDEKAQIINDMLDLQVSSKIFLGSLYHAKTLNPMDYIFEALGIRLLPLAQKQREYKLIAQYIQNGFSSYRPDSIINIFALERRGEAERISQWKDLKNRTYLWHGSKTINFMGILSQGLRIAPPEAPATGYMFGKGIYFADSFEKSYGYCQNYYSYSRDQQPKLLLLCEVALGTSLELYKANYITNLEAPYKSVKGCGNAGPDPKYNEVLANGAIVPLGKRIQYNYKSEKGEKIYPTLRYNEFIVYDISQVRVRYLIQIK